MVFKQIRTYFVFIVFLLTSSVSAFAADPSLTGSLKNFATGFSSLFLGAGSSVVWIAIFMLATFFGIGFTLKSFLDKVESLKGKVSGTISFSIAAIVLGSFLIKDGKFIGSQDAIFAMYDGFGDFLKIMLAAGLILYWGIRYYLYLKEEDNKLDVTILSLTLYSSGSLLGKLFVADGFLVNYNVAFSPFGSVISFITNIAFFACWYGIIRFIFSAFSRKDPTKAAASAIKKKRDATKDMKSLIKNLKTDITKLSKYEKDYLVGSEINPSAVKRSIGVLSAILNSINSTIIKIAREQEQFSSKGNKGSAVAKSMLKRLDSGKIANNQESITQVIQNINAIIQDINNNNDVLGYVNNLVRELGQLNTYLETEIKFDQEFEVQTEDMLSRVENELSAGAVPGHEDEITTLLNGIETQISHIQGSAEANVDATDLRTLLQQVANNPSLNNAELISITMEILTFINDHDGTPFVNKAELLTKLERWGRVADSVIQALNIN